jgi:hypothetical protein
VGLPGPSRRTRVNFGTLPTLFERIGIMKSGIVYVYGKSIAAFVATTTPINNRTGNMYIVKYIEKGI